MARAGEAVAIDAETGACAEEHGSIDGVGVIDGYAIGLEVEGAGDEPAWPPNAFGVLSERDPVTINLLTPE